MKYIMLAFLILALSSFNSNLYDDSAALSNESVITPEVIFPEDFLVEYDENGLAILTKYLGPGGDVVIPDGINIIGRHVFDLITYTDGRVITSVYIPDTVTVIEDYAFLCCYRIDTGLRQVRMSSNIEYIGVSAFSDCIYLETITFDSLPQTTVSIHDKAFSYCISLKELQLPASVLLGGDVFSNTDLDEEYSAKYNTLPATAPVEIPAVPELKPEDMVIVPEVIEYQNDEDIIPNDNETVILSIQPDTLTAIGTTLTIQNNSSLECFYGSDFMIEKKEDDKWYSINFIADFTAEEFVLSPNSSTEMSIQWENYYGALPYGEYRILKEINIDNTNSYYCCEFNILP